MPVVIKELHIKVNVEEKPSEPGEPRNSQAKISENLIDACVEKVLEVLKQKDHR